MERLSFSKSQPAAVPAKIRKASRARINKLWQNRTPDLNESLTVTNALINSIGEGVILIDEYGYINHINQPALDILGYERKELEGRWFQDVVTSYYKDGKPMPPEERLMARAFITGKPVSETIQYRRKDGSLVPVFNTSSPFIVKDKPVGGILVFRDVTKELQIEKAKDEFVSLASHQLRTPLTSIRFFAELLTDSHYGELTKKQRDYIDKILFSTDRMISLVTELLNISRLNLGELEIKPVATDINNFVREQLAEVMPMAAKARVTLTFTSEVEKKESVLIDRTLLSQVVHNLLTNAIRYSAESDKGRVKVTLSKAKKHYCLEVSDNGIGIPPEAKSRIYERFYRAENARHMRVEGTGLGLYLVKFIIESSGGTISHRSAQGKGTTFKICIPLGGMSAYKKGSLPNSGA